MSEREELRVLHRSAEERHAAILAQAEAMGVDEEFVSDLVDNFYTAIRADAVLGPIFQNAIGDHWDRHLGTMKDFWASVALDAGRYDGRPVPKHMSVQGIEEAHFALWLSLFQKTLQQMTDKPETVQFFLSRAQRIAQSLRLAIETRASFPAWNTAQS